MNEEKTKPCPMCKKEVAQDARICPYCKSDLSVGGNIGKILTSIGVILFTLVLLTILIFSCRFFWQ
jgi:hypothetical protein